MVSLHKLKTLFSSVNNTDKNKVNDCKIFNSFHWKGVDWWMFGTSQCQAVGLRYVRPEGRDLIRVSGID